MDYSEPADFEPQIKRGSCQYSSNPASDCRRPLDKKTWNFFYVLGRVYNGVRFRASCLVMEKSSDRLNNHSELFFVSYQVRTVPSPSGQ